MPGTHAVALPTPNYIFDTYEPFLYERQLPIHYFLKGVVKLKQVKYEYFSEKEVLKWKLKPEMWQRLDIAREESGIPYVITSGFRTKEHNESVGGSPTSSHLEGLGCDIRARNWVEVGKIVDGARKAGITGISVYTKSSHVHLDMKPYRLEVIDK